MPNMSREYFKQRPSRHRQRHGSDADIATFWRCEKCCAPVSYNIEVALGESHITVKEEKVKSNSTEDRRFEWFHLPSIDDRFRPHS